MTVNMSDTGAKSVKYAQIGRPGPFRAADRYFRCFGQKIGLPLHDLLEGLADVDRKMADIKLHQLGMRRPCGGLSHGLRSE